MTRADAIDIIRDDLSVLDAYVNDSTPLPSDESDPYYKAERAINQIRVALDSLTINPSEAAK